MQVIWLTTVIANITLSLLLIVRNLYIKYSWLTISAILSVFLDAYFGILKTTYPTLYMPSHNTVFFLFLFFDGMVVFEAIARGKKWLEIGMCGLICLDLATMAAKHSGDLWAGYYLSNASRIYNMLLLVWIIFKLKEERYESLYH